MAFAVGRLEATKNPWRRGRLSSKSPVGLGLTAPQSPCASSTWMNSGQVHKYLRITKCQTLALGIARCSIAPTPPCTARCMSSMVKRRSKLPVGSAPVHEALEKLDPIYHSRSLITRGALRCKVSGEVWKLLPRAWDHVSQGCKDPDHCTFTYSPKPKCPNRFT